MSNVIPDDLMSWLKCLHIEHLSELQYGELAKIDINRPEDQDALIELAFMPEFVGANDVSKASLLAILEKVETFPEAQVREMLWRAGPLAEALQDYVAFFQKLQRRCMGL